MAKVKFSTGNFDVVVEGTFSDEQKEKAENAALQHILQRDGATKAYIELAGEKNSKGNLQLPEGFKRDSLPFNADNAAKMKAAFTNAMSTYGSFTISEVTEHVAGETVSSRSMATKMWEEQVRDNPAFRKVLNIARDATDEQGIEACHSFLQTTRKQKPAPEGEPTTENAAA